MNRYEKRLSHVRTKMMEQGIDTLILTPGGAMRYLTGFSEDGHERLIALVVPDDRPWLFITPALNAAQVRENPAGIDDIRVWDDAEGWETLLASICTDLNLDIGIIGLDDNMPARFAIRLQEKLSTALLKLAGPIFIPLRSVKDNIEIASLANAAEATDSATAIAYEVCKAGATEREVANAIESHFALVGFEKTFETIVAAGQNGASPHHHTGRTKLKLGDVVVLDYGAKVDDYCGDITRTVSIGNASAQVREVYDTVYNAHQAGLEAIKPGATSHDVDRAVRKVIEDAGYGEFFLHRTGHGIGLDGHEAPNIVSGDRTPLMPGHCFSIEPGIYLPGQYGIRLENIVSVDEDGYPRVLNAEIPPTIPMVG